MILEEETYENFGYYPSDLSHRSHKPILAKCDRCGKVRVIRKGEYHPLCLSCVKREWHPELDNSGWLFTKYWQERMSSHEISDVIGCGHNAVVRALRRLGITVRTVSESKKGYKLSEDTRKRIGKSGKGKVPWNKGKHLSVEHKEKIVEATKGEKNHNYGKEFSKKTKAKMRKARKHRKFPKHCTKPERIWQEIAIEKHSLPFKYTGDGAFWIGEKPSINPDFIHLTKKIAVEIFSYWHDPLKRNGKVRYSHTYEGRKKILKKRGWKLIVFWQEDLERGDAEAFVLNLLKKEGVIK